MPEQVKVFVNYRRDDSSYPAALIAKHLVDRFGDTHVFIDIDKIAAGDDLKRVINETLDRCDVLIVVIGPRWSELLQRRPAETEDYVRHEIVYALARGKRVLPVFVGNATPTALHAVPDDLAALKTINALTLDEKYLKQHITALVEAVQGRRFEDIVRDLKQRIRSARHAQVAGVAIGLVVFLAASVAFLDFFTLDTRFTSLTIWLGGLGAAPRWSGDVVIVTIDGETEKKLGRGFDRSWRREHAKLVDRLSQAGARTIAFDISFKGPMPEEDELLARAFSNARAHKTAIVVAVFEAFEDGAPLAPEPLKKVLGGRVDGEEEHGWAIACLGEKLRYARSMPLVVKHGEVLLPSLALAAFSGGGRVIQEETRPGRGEQKRDPFAPLEIGVRMTASSKTEKVGFSSVEEVLPDHVQDSCPAIAPKDSVALQLLNPAPPGFWLQPPRRLAYEQVLGDTSPEALVLVNGKIVLVGVTKPNTDVRTFAAGPTTERRYGIEYHADQLDAISRGDVIRPLDEFWEFVLMLLLALGGAYGQRWGAARPPLVRRGALFGLGIFYLAMAIYVYRQHGVLLNLPYEISAFALAYWAMCWLEKRSPGNRWPFASMRS